MPLRQRYKAHLISTVPPSSSSPSSNSDAEHFSYAEPIHLILDHRRSHLDQNRQNAQLEQYDKNTLHRAKEWKSIGLDSQFMMLSDANHAKATKAGYEICGRTRFGWRPPQHI